MGLPTVLGAPALRSTAILVLLTAAAMGAAGVQPAGGQAQPEPQRTAAEASATPTDPLAGRAVAEIHVVGNATVAAETVRYHLGVAHGEPYAPAALDQGLRRLWATGLVEDVKVDAELLEAGTVRLTVRLEERPVVAGILYRGLERLSETELRERLLREGIELGEGGLLRRGELERLAAAAGALYRERGFELARIATALEPAGPGRVRVVVSVDEGRRLRIGDIQFEGNTVFSDARLRRALDETRPSGPIARLRKKDRLDRAALDRDLERVEERYRRAGYKDATVGEPEIAVPGEAGDGAELTITVPVEEGDRWRLGGVSFSGNEQFSDERLLALFERPGSGWLGSRFVDDGLERVRELYGRAGYMTARVESVLVERGERLADVLVRIEEGSRYRVGRIEIEGNTDTRDKVIRRELAIQEGTILDATALRRSLLRLGQLDFFELDEQEPVAFELDDEAGRVDLTLRGREADRTTLLFGGGYSQAYGLFGQFQYATRNFQGRGETLSVDLQTGSDITQIQAGYTVPWLFDRRQSVSGQLFVTEQSLTFGGERLTRELDGARLSWSRRLGLFQSLSVGYGYQETRDLRLRTGDDGELLSEELAREISSLRLAYGLDRIDHPYQPTRGLALGGSLETAGGFLGGDARLVRGRADLGLYQPLWGRPRRPRGILGFHLEAGAVRPLGGTELTFNDRYYRGGENSVRGFDSQGVLPRGPGGLELVDGSGFLLGGDRYLEAKLELHLPLNELLRLVAFTDAGQAWAEGQPFDLSGLRHTAGLELRLTTPLFPYPLRFIWAENLDPLPGDRFKSFQFSFGTSF